MDRPQLIRRLRIVVSGLFALVAVVLCVLWVRSYWRMDQWIFRSSPTEFAAATAIRGQLTFGRSNDPMLLQVFQDEWTRRGFAMENIEAEIGGPVAYFPASTASLHDTKELVRLPRYRRQPFIVAPGTTYSEVILPYWLLVLPFVSLAVLLLCVPARFSLCTLLIVTMLLAVLLGMGVWVVR
jgi:hypothetical protein